MIINWFRERKARKAKEAADAAHRQFLISFKAEFAKLDSETHQTVLTHAKAMARGMMMRFLDDRGVSRCRLCLSTDTLHKRFITRKRDPKRDGPGKPTITGVIFLCTEHKDVAMPGRTDEKGKPEPSIQSNAATSKLEPEAIKGMLEPYEKAAKEGKSPHDLHPPLPKHLRIVEPEPSLRTGAEAGRGE